MSRHECCGSHEEHFGFCPLLEIEENCIASHHAVRYTLIEDRAYAIVCSECTTKIEELEKDNGSERTNR